MQTSDKHIYRKGKKVLVPTADTAHTTKHVAATIWATSANGDGVLVDMPDGSRRTYSKSNLHVIPTKQYTSPKTALQALRGTLTPIKRQALLMAHYLLERGPGPVHVWPVTANTQSNAHKFRTYLANYLVNGTDTHVGHQVEYPTVPFAMLLEARAHDLGYQFIDYSEE